MLLLLLNTERRLFATLRVVAYDLPMPIRHDAELPLRHRCAICRGLLPLFTPCAMIDATIRYARVADAPCRATLFRYSGSAVIMP